MISQYQLEMMEEEQAHEDYMREAYQAEADAIAEAEELEAWGEYVLDCYARRGLEAPRFLDHASIMEDLDQLGPNDPLYQELKGE